MLKMKKWLKISIIALVLLTAVIAIVHLTTRTPDVEGAILVNGEAVSIGELELRDVSGVMVNGKGEERQIEAQGINLAELCGDDFASAEITSSDEYHAVVNYDESENAFIIISDDGSFRLVVFGDENAKRDVKNVARIDTK